jgi:hypothetical protein
VNKFQQLVLEGMSAESHPRDWMTVPEPNPKEFFRLQFQEGLREYLARNGSAAEGFALVWQRTLSRVGLQETDLAELYWELVQWACSYDLFTHSEQPNPLGGYPES